jgi:mono/diheme cytochrome c family protein
LGSRSYLYVVPCLAVLTLFAALFSRSVLPLRAQNSVAAHQNTPQTEFVATPSPERLARGRYIVTAVAHCFGCHGEPDFKNLASQPKPGTEGAGDLPKDESFNDVPIEPVLPHPNLTPDKETGAGTWTDAQFERAIRHGIGHDGRILTGDMPYAFFRSMTDEDVSSVIVYLRSLPPVHHVLPQRKLSYTPKVDFQPEMEPAIPPNATDQVKHGWYLVRLAQCNDCHSPYDKDGNVLPGKMFGGGLTMTGPWGNVVSANITSDPSGIAHYDTAMFIKTIRTGRASGGVRDLSTIMPYSYFRNMTDDDLSAIFAYLRTVTPVCHRLDNSESAVYCPLCRQKHGFGDHNEPPPQIAKDSPK